MRHFLLIAVCLGLAEMCGVFRVEASAGDGFANTQIADKVLAQVPNEVPPPDVLPPPSLGPDFGIPEGLKTKPEVLLPSLGYGRPQSFPLTPSTCFEVGYKCYVYGFHEDALAFANHGLKLCNHARIYLLKTLCEMQLGRSDDARSTLIKYRDASLRPEESFGLRVARERLNDPMRVRLDTLLSAWNQGY